jgi:hypothetical protein
VVNAKTGDTVRLSYKSIATIAAAAAPLVLAFAGWMASLNNHIAANGAEIRSLKQFITTMDARGTSRFQNDIQALFREAEISSAENRAEIDAIKRAIQNR